MVDYFKTLNGRLDVYFLRHGESEDNSAGIIQGRRDLPLSEEGRRQSESAAPWFVDRGIGVILTSPLRRASQTAETVGRSLGMEVRILEALNELDTGIFTGLTMEQISRRHPAAWRSFRRQSWEGVPGAESIASLLERSELLWKTLGRLFDKGTGNLLCVTHSGILQWIIKSTFGQHSWMPLVPVGNCSVCQFSLDNDIQSSHPGYYFEWTRLNYLPLGAAESSGNAPGAQAGPSGGMPKGRDASSSGTLDGGLFGRHARTQG
jgi:broad specificity phosphatase PhoE